jgi:tetratricopeptide (TPR) repeat protein
MACVSCGVQTEPEVYLCEKCQTDAQTRNQLGASIAIFTSPLNTLLEGESAVLNVETSRTTDTLNLFITPSQEKQDVEALEFSLENLEAAGAESLQSSLVRMLLNMGLSLDLEKKPIPVLSDTELTLAKKVLRAADELENKYPDSMDTNLFHLAGSFFYSLSSADCGVITTSDRKYHLTKAKEYYDKALCIEPESILAWKNKAKVLLEIGENTEAISCMNWILDNLTLDDGDNSVLLNKGIALYNLGKLEEAISCFDKVIDKDPASVMAWHKKGDVFTKMGRWGGTIQCFNEALKHDPSRDDIWLSMGETYISHEKYQEASRSLDEVLKINIWNAEAWYLQGIVFSKIGRWGAAVQCLDKTLSLNPSHILALKVKGDVLVGTNRFEDALKCFERALKFQPNNHEVLTSKGRLLKLMNRYDEALRVIDSALSIKKDYPKALFERGDILQETGKAYKALKSFDSALKIDPDAFETYYRKGLTLEKLRRYNEAIQCYDRALKLNPKFKSAERAKSDCLNRIKDKSK